MRFANRADAGRQLARALEPMGFEKPVVVAIPRGGVPVGFEVARALHAPLDVIVVRKLGAPGEEELGIGAIAEGGIVFLHELLVERLGVTRRYLERVRRAEMAEIDRRIDLYRAGRAPVDLHGKTVLLVDDGLATGVTTHAAIRALRLQGPHAIVLAVPVGARETVDELRPEVDEAVCLRSPEDFYAVGVWYDDFGPTRDEEVIELLDRARESQDRDAMSAARANVGPMAGVSHEQTMSEGGVRR